MDGLMMILIRIIIKKDDDNEPNMYLYFNLVSNIFFKSNYFYIFVHSPIYPSKWLLSCKLNNIFSCEKFKSKIIYYNKKRILTSYDNSFYYY